MTKQQYKRIHKILMKIRSTYDPQALNLNFFELRKHRANYLRFRHIKTSVESRKESYLFAIREALAGPVGKLP